MKNTLKAVQNWILLVQHRQEQLRVLSAIWNHFVYVMVNKGNIVDGSGGSLIALAVNVAQKKSKIKQSLKVIFVSAILNQ